MSETVFERAPPQIAIPIRSPRQRAQGAAVFGGTEVVQGTWVDCVEQPSLTIPVTQPSKALHARNEATRGKITLISVNSPGCVSTSIEPPCCLTMMS
jgi:hypothetical protein